MDGVEQEVGYKPDVGFQQDSREPLAHLSLTDSTEFWLIQWPLNQPPDFDGKEVTVSLDNDGCLGSFSGSSGKAYDLVSCSAQQPDATVFVSTGSKTKIAGKISRRVSIVHYPDPKQLEKQEAEKKSKRLSQISGGSTLRNSSTHSGVTSSQGTRIRNPLSSVGDPSSSSGKRRKREHHGSDRSTLDRG